MLQAIRDRATGWIAYTIIFLICITFALFGLNAYFNNPPVLDVAEVGGTAITAQEYQRAYQNERSRLQNMLGDNFNPALLSSLGIKQQVLQRLVDQQVLLQTTTANGMRIGDKQLQQAIVSQSVFQQEGRFDNERYQRVLRQTGSTGAGYEQSLRESMLAEQLQQGIMTSTLLTQTELDQLLALLRQQREVAYLTLSQKHFAEQIELEDADIEAYYNENSQRFTSPEQVKLEYLELTLVQMAAALPISEQEIADEYERQKEQFVRAEERAASHILLTLAEDADEAAQSAVEGQAKTLYESIASEAKTFDQVMQEAQEKGLEVADLGIIDRGMMESVFEDALFALAEVGQVSEPVKTSFGYHIIRLDKINAEQVEPLAEVRDQLERDLRQRKAEPEFYDAADTLANLSFENADNLQAAAEALAMTPAETDWIQRGAGGQGVARFPKVQTAAFSPDVLERGLNSEVLEVEPSHIIVVRVLEHQEAKVLDLAQARPQVAAELREQKAREALQQASDDLFKRAENGETLASLAEAASAELSEARLIGRTETGVDNAILSEVFKLPPPVNDKASMGRATLASGDQVLMAISAVVAGTQDELKEAEIEALSRRLQTQLGGAQFQALVESRRQQTDIVTFPERL